MSRQASPAQLTPQPGQQHPQHSARSQHIPDHSRYSHNHLDSPMSAGPGPTFVVGMPPQPVQPSASTSSSRGKGKAYATGFTANAEDVKYAAKYRDLKKKVKEIEADNDKLYFKVMQAKRNIQRAKLERAILYERLSTVPASPPPNHTALPPHHLSGPIHGGVPSIAPPAPGTVTYEQHHVARHHPHELQQGPPPPERHGRAPREQGHSRKRPHREVEYAASPPPSPPHAYPPPPTQLPIEAPQHAVSIRKTDGKIIYVAADPQGMPIKLANGEYQIVDNNIVPPYVPPPAAPAAVVSAPATTSRRRGGRSTREPVETESRERAREQVILPGPATLHPPLNASTFRSHSSGGAPLPPGGQLSPPMQNTRVPVQGGHHVQAIAPRDSAAVIERELELQREFEQEREMRERERERHERHELRERERGRHAHAPPQSHAHVHHPGDVAPPVERDRSRRHDLHELAGSPPPQSNVSMIRGEPLAPSPSQMSPTQGHTHAHRSHSMHSHQSHHSHHSHGHRSHSHSHSGSPMNSPTDSRPPQPPNNMRIHGHQRIGPGTNINREYNIRDRDVDEREDRASPGSATPSGAAPGSSTSRVPTPPYMRTSTATGAAINANALPLRDNENRDVEMDTAEPSSTSVRPPSRDRKMSGTPS